METQKIEGLWTHLYWLTVLSSQGSFTGAAGRLGVSKAAMSQRIAELERAAGVSLVQRTTRSVRLTEAGQRLVERTRDQFDFIAESFSSVRDSAGVARGIVRVTAPVAFSRQQLLPRLAEFLRENSEVRVQLELSDRLISLASEGFDLAIRHSLFAPETHVATALCSTQSLIVATPAYLRRRSLPTRPEDLSSHSCLFYPRAQEMPAWTFERVSGRKSSSERVTVPIDGPLAANNSEALRQGALDSLGIALVPDFSAQQELRSGKLIRLLPEWKPVGAFADQLFVVRPYASHVPLAVSTFVAFLRQTFRGGFGD